MSNQKEPAMEKTPELKIVKSIVKLFSGAGFPSDFEEAEKLIKDYGETEFELGHKAGMDKADIMFSVKNDLGTQPPQAVTGDAMEVARRIHFLTNSSHGCRMEHDLIEFITPIIQQYGDARASEIQTEHEKEFKRAEQLESRIRHLEEALSEKNDPAPSQQELDRMERFLQRMWDFQNNQG
jgi:hypothetical protein